MDRVAICPFVSTKTGLFVDKESKMSPLSMKYSESMDKVMILQVLSTEQDHIVDVRMSLLCCVG